MNNFQRNFWHNEKFNYGGFAFSRSEIVEDAKKQGFTDKQALDIMCYTCNNQKPLKTENIVEIDGKKWAKENITYLGD